MLVCGVAALSKVVAWIVTVAGLGRRQTANPPW
jgi:hypothetical protein